MFQMITNKLAERTERLYWSCTDLPRLCTKRHFSGDQEGELETLSRMTNRRRPTVHDDFPSSLTSLFFFSIVQNRMKILEKRPNYTKIRWA